MIGETILGLFGALLLYIGVIILPALIVVGISTLIKISFERRTAHRMKLSEVISISFGVALVILGFIGVIAVLLGV